MPEDAGSPLGAGGGVPPVNTGQSFPSAPEGHTFTDFPVAAAIILHYLTCGIFSLIWINLMHGRLPKVRPDDPSAGRAIGFCFIPFFNLYWIFFSYRRLCLRVDEYRNLYGLPPSNLTGMATTNCIFQVIPYINVLIGYTIITPIFIGQMQASVNELVRTGATTPPRAALPPAPAPTRGFPGWAIALIICGALLPMIAIMAALLLPALANAKRKAQQISCMNNLRQIGLSFRMWENDNGDQFPFNVSTNKKGTLELCQPGADGFDQNSWRHVQLISNYLATPYVLACPADNGTQAATDFSHLQASNVSYEIHSGANVTDANPQAVLAICPIHHTVLFVDGHVQLMTESAMRNLLAEPGAMNPEKR